MIIKIINYTFIFIIVFCKNDFFSLGIKNPNKITIKGSETMLELSYILTKSYIRKHNNISIQIMGGGSGVGIISMINGISDLANASRKIKLKELEKIKSKNKILKQWTIAMDAIIIYVHPDNPVKKIRIQDLKSIYLGKIRNWKEIGGKDAAIVLYGRESNSGTYFFFKKKILNGENFYHRIISLSGQGSIVNAITKDKNAIGYGGYTTSQKLKFLSIEDKNKNSYVANSKNIRASKYPFIRPLLVYVLFDKLEKKPYISDYIQWMLTEEGQSLVEKSGYFPVKGLK